MYIIVVGAGPVGMSLVEIALQDGHNVALIEADEKRAQDASKKFDALVLHGDIGEGDILREAGGEQADALVAATSDDSANLMAMFLGAERGIKTLISVVNEPGHKRLFERLGVHVLVDPEVIVARYLYGLLRQPKLEDVVTLPGGQQVFQITLKEDCPLLSKSLAQAGEEKLLPPGLLIVSIKRGDDSLVPTGKTVLEAGDHLTVFTHEAVSNRQLKVFTG